MKNKSLKISLYIFLYFCIVGALLWVFTLFSQKDFLSVLQNLWIALIFGGISVVFAALKDNEAYSKVIWQKGGGRKVNWMDEPRFFAKRSRNLERINRACGMK